jgi:hypothetical protein
MDHVEVLLRLLRAGPAGLAQDELVRETARPAALVETALADLVRGGLVSTEDDAGGLPRLKYDPQSEDHRRAVEELATMYNERPVTLIRAIYDRAAQPVISFADAFRVRGGTS